MSTSELTFNQSWDEQALAARKQELMTAMNMVVDFLAPTWNRREGPRRSGRERRDARSDALYADRRSGRDRRTSDRRMPPPERLRLLRQELQQIIEIQESQTAPS